MSDLGIGTIGEGLDIGGSPREDVNKVSEEDRKRIQENQQKAKQVAQQIKKDKKSNNDMANFLSYLLDKLDNEDIVSGIYNVFFKAKNPKTDMTYLRKNPNTIVIVGIFAPFYWEEIEKFGLTSFFESIHIGGHYPELEQYAEYLKKLSSKYHDNIPVDKEEFLKFLLNVIDYFGISLNSDKENPTLSIREKIENMLYG